ncbi:hypothetical protein VOLCADRAFT_84837 [Volvox carteri f. nagariensis]|uniref:Uncharacterized protein n=1 Tax=Volvox carteri f. nagariensis TaxID=3068 RepID=D8UKX0_VOLCA|nr:uncharacterized protein VOLCADRAFT_84837 [Volvox carteri f. nagariensis]EFJ39622.1 hypothetical protein VOLCADRAFT_84837 [Volvox carteri f. nagariensis]|eukprot:XP_002959306.1 hypothetical protein VOLCADRAFT_84837 [Volvox carteri f. nagariensis]
MAALTPRTPCIVSAVRTPLGAFQGALSSYTAMELGAFAIRGALERAGVRPEDVDEVIFGNVISANLGQAPATQAALGAGLPPSTPCTLVNKVCSSGLKAVMLAAQAIMAGSADVIVAGGMESMSNAPHYLPGARKGLRLGDGSVVDGLVKDGLWDPYGNIHMGSCAEMCADRFAVGRQQQDEHALQSHRRAVAAAAAGHTAAEIVPVPRPGGGGGPGSYIWEDESLSKMDPVRLTALKPYFRRDGGTVTAGNASPMTDGAAALVIASYEAVQRLGLPLLAAVRGFADAAQSPEWFTTAPALAVPRALKHAGLTSASDVDYWEVNEAFSVVDLVNRQLLGLPAERVNVFGGSVALGHPIGASGARILVTLLNVLRSKGGRRGCAAICNGGGGASSIVVEAMPPPLDKQQQQQQLPTAAAAMTRQQSQL